MSYPKPVREALNAFRKAGLPAVVQSRSKHFEIVVCGERYMTLSHGSKGAISDLPNQIRRSIRAAAEKAGTKV